MLSIFLRLSPMDMLHQQECDEHEYEAEDEERRIAEEVDRTAGKRRGYDGSQLRVGMIIMQNVNIVPNTWLM